MYVGICKSIKGDVKPIWASLEVIIGWWIGSIKSKILVGLEVTLGGIDIKFEVEGINILVRLEIIFTDIYWLFIELVLASIDSVSYWDIRKSNIDSKNTYVFDIE